MPIYCFGFGGVIPPCKASSLDRAKVKGIVDTYLKGT